MGDGRPYSPSFNSTLLFAIAIVMLVLSLMLFSGNMNGKNGHVLVSKDLLRQMIASEINEIILEKHNSNNNKLDGRQSLSSSYPEIKKLHASEKLRILVTGGAGFVGSHLVDRLMIQVIV